jgi:hypothetical protein
MIEITSKNDLHSDKMEVIKNKKLVSMLSNFPNIINKFLGDLPKDDYPVLNTFKGSIPLFI